MYSQFQEKRASRKAPAGTTSSCSLESISQMCRRSEQRTATVQRKQLKKNKTLSSCMQAGSRPPDETPLSSKHLLALPLQRCSAFMWGRMATRVEAICQVSPHPVNNPDRLEAFAESRLITHAKNSTFHHRSVVRGALQYLQPLHKWRLLCLRFQSCEIPVPAKEYFPPRKQRLLNPFQILLITAV